MKEKLKKIVFGYLPGFITGIIVCGTVSVIAATYFPSSDVTYDNKKSGLTSTNVQGAIDELYTTCFPLTAGEQIIEENNLEQDSYECRYFFVGSNPNNYITFNNESWRIISIGCDNTIKIMRDESIGNMSWDIPGSNNWNRPADLNTYLNSTYYNSLTSTAQKQIVAATYYAGGITENNNDLQNQINDEKLVVSNVKVALPTVSEYLRTNSNDNCKTYNANNDNYNTCKNSNWMYYSSNFWWTLSPRHGDSNFVFYGTSSGNLSFYMSSYDASVRPVVTLSSSVKITGGDGSQSNTYIIE